MAQEEIKLVGSFDDQITKKLQSLNREINNIGRSFERFNKKLSPVTKSMAKMAMSAREFSNAMKSQKNSIDSSARSMREYSKQAGKMSNAMRKVTDARMKSQRQMGLTRAQARSARGGIGAAGAGVAPVLPSLPKAPTAPSYSPKVKSGGKAAKDVGATAGQSFMKNVASTAIGVGIASAFMNGVQGLKNMFMAPFQKFGAAFQERMGDEMDDIKSAGGLYALDLDLTAESGNKRLFNNFNEALRYQEEINTRMAQSASNLPGTTSEFVDMNRRMTDTLQMVMENNREEFVKLGESQGADISMGGTDAAKEALAQVGQNLTESLMLASAGQQGGLPMDLAIQQLMNKEKGKIKMQAFTNKFRAAFQKNPLLKNFLMRAEAELNATEAGSAKRLEIIGDVYQRAIPQQQIDKMRGSLKGLMESVRSGLLDPQGGLFGLSRAVQDFDAQGNVTGELMKANTNQLGEKLYKLSEDLKDAAGQPLFKEGKEVKKGAELTVRELRDLGYIVKDTGEVFHKDGGDAVGELSTSSTYLFEQIREIAANYGSVLTQFVGMLPTVFDPFSKMTKALIPMREMSIEFYRVFQTTNEQLFKHVDYLKATGDSAQKGVATRLGKQVMQRSALFTLADFLAGTGAMDAAEAEKMKKQFVSSASMSAEGVAGFDKVAADSFKKMFESLMGSDFIEEVGKMGGILIGGIMRTTFDVISGIFNSLVKKETGSRIVDGFLKGFETQFGDMGGFSGFMEKVNAMLMQAIDFAGNFLITEVIPFMFRSLIQFITAGLSGQTGLVGKLLSGALIYGLANAAVGAVTSVMAMAAAAQKAAFSLATLGAGGVGRTKGRAAVAAQQAVRGPLVQASKVKEFLLGDISKMADKRQQNLAKFGKKGGALKNASMGLGQGNMAMAGLKAGAKMGAVGGIINAITKMLEGQSPLDAISAGLASAGGSAIGAAIGTIIFPGIGTAIGAMIGGFIADTEAVIAPVRGAIESIIGAVTDTVGIFGDLFSFIGDIISAVMSMIPGLDRAADGFNLLGAVVFALLSPFRMLELGILGLKVILLEAYKAIAGFIPGLEFKQQKELDEGKSKLESKTDKFTVEGRKAAGFSLQQQKDEEYAKWKNASTDEEKNRHVRYMRVIEDLIKAEQGRMPKNSAAAKATEEAAAAMAKLRDQAKTAGSTFENNEKFTGADGKEYGWAMKEGEKVLVEWGSAATAAQEAAKAIQSIEQAAADAGAFDKDLGIDTEWEGWDTIKPEMPEPPKPEPLEVDGEVTVGGNFFQKVGALLQGKKVRFGEEAKEPAAATELKETTERIVEKGPVTDLKETTEKIVETPKVAEAGANIPGRVEGKETIVTGNEFIDKGGIIGAISRFFGGGQEDKIVPTETTNPEVAQALKEVAENIATFSEMDSNEGLARILANAEAAGANDIIDPEAGPLPMFEFESAVDGLNKIAEILSGIADNLAPEGGAVDVTPADQGGENLLVKGAADVVSGTLPGMIFNGIKGLFGGGETTAPAAPEAPTAPLIDVTGPIQEAVAGLNTAVSTFTMAAGEAETSLTNAGTSAGTAADYFADCLSQAETAVSNAVSVVEAGAVAANDALVGAATGAGAAITMAAQGLATALGNAARSMASAVGAATSAGAVASGGVAFDGHSGGDKPNLMPLGKAIETEKKMMPPGADLVIANSSETIIPAFDGHVGDGFKGLSFAELESAAGFNRMKSYSEQIQEVADKTAANFSGMSGALGGGSATLQAMEALGNANGLITTSGFRPGDPGFHGANRARDLSDGSGETPGMNKVANIMASQFGSSLTELIYTPLGYSIKNGQKTGLISPDNHYHHIHVAVADGLAKAAVFNNQAAAERYERANMPAGAKPMQVDLSSMTANSSEFTSGGKGDISIGDINVSIDGAQDRKAIANDVAEELLYAIKKATYGELYTS